MTTPRELPELYADSVLDPLWKLVNGDNDHPVYQAALSFATRLAESEARAERLRGFAQAVMEDWPEGDLDGGYRQDLAERFGLLRAVERYSPCGENCGCSEYFSENEWKDGQQCYRMTTLLTGDPKSDAAIDAAIAQEAGREAASA